VQASIDLLMLVQGMDRQSIPVDGEVRAAEFLSYKNVLPPITKENRFTIEWLKLTALSKLIQEQIPIAKDYANSDISGTRPTVSTTPSRPKHWTITVMGTLGGLLLSILGSVAIESWKKIISNNTCRQKIAEIKHAWKR
jgi:hypothetical protein